MWTVKSWSVFWIFLNYRIFSIPSPVIHDSDSIITAHLQTLWRISVVCENSVSVVNPLESRLIFGKFHFISFYTLCADAVIFPNDQNLSFGDGDETHPVYLVGHFLRLSANMYKQHWGDRKHCLQRQRAIGWDRQRSISLWILRNTN